MQGKQRVAQCEADASPPVGGHRRDDQRGGGALDLFDAHPALSDPRQPEQPLVAAHPQPSLAIVGSTPGANGPGGQCVNTTDSAVRLTHIPTGIVVTCQNEKSQLLNKEAAFRVLKAKLFELEEQKRQAEIDELRGERMENSFGSQIRNYVMYPYQMVKDLRSGVETGDVDGVLGGNLEEFVIGYHKWKAAQ